MGLLRALGIALLLAAAPAFAAQSEYQVKSVFLFNFSQFVEWPEQSLGDATAPFVICLLGKDHFGTELDAAVQAETVQGHPLQIRRLREPEMVQSCQMVFIDDSAVGRLDTVLNSLNGKPVLTVSDIAGSAEHGTIIQFTSEKSRLRLRINVAAAKASGLMISSKLLRPAEIVGAAAG